jgi:hypothetical protein
MKPNPLPATPAAKRLGCTCEVTKNADGHSSLFVPLTCALHSQFYQHPKEE